MSDFTRRTSCESHGIVERTLILAMKVDGIGVAVPGYVTRIRFSSRETPRRDSGSQILLTAGPIRQRAATALGGHPKAAINRHRKAGN